MQDTGSAKIAHLTERVDDTIHTEQPSAFSHLSPSKTDPSTPNSTLGGIERADLKTELQSPNNPDIENKLPQNLSTKDSIKIDSVQSSNDASTNSFQASQVTAPSNPFVFSQIQHVHGETPNELQSHQKLYPKTQGLNPYDLNQNDLNQNTVAWQEPNQRYAHGAQDCKPYESGQYEQVRKLHKSLHKSAQYYSDYSAYSDYADYTDYADDLAYSDYADYDSSDITSLVSCEDDYVLPADWLEQAIFEDTQNLHLKPDLFEYELAALNLCSEELQNNPQRLQILLEELKNPSISALLSSNMLREILCENGWFSYNLGGNYAVRLGQVVMSQKICSTLQRDDSTVQIIEAGTGVGKTYAYLLPLLLMRSKSLISTHTKALQDQLVNEDLPNLLRLLDLESHISYCALKGKGNYLCHFKLDKLEPQVFINHLENYQQNNNSTHTKQYHQTSKQQSAEQYHQNSDLNTSFAEDHAWSKYEGDPYAASSKNGSNKLPEHIMQHFNQEQEILHQVFDKRIRQILLQVRDYLVWSMQGDTLLTSDRTLDHLPLYCGEIDNVFKHLQKPLNLSDEDVALCFANLDAIRTYFSCNSSPCGFCKNCFTDDETFVCFYEQAYHLACSSDIAVVNHALMCSKAIPKDTVENSLKQTAQQSFIYQQLISLAQELTVPWSTALANGTAHQAMGSDATSLADKIAQCVLGNFAVFNFTQDLKAALYERIKHLIIRNLSISSTCILQELTDKCAPYKMHVLMILETISDNAETWTEQLQQIPSLQINATYMALEFLNKCADFVEELKSVINQLLTNEGDANSGYHSNSADLNHAEYNNNSNNANSQFYSNCKNSNFKFSQYYDSSNVKSSQHSASATGTAIYAHANTSDQVSDSNDCDDIGYKIDLLLTHHSTVVFDEAHELEKVFNNIYSQSLHSSSIQHFIQDLAKLKDRCGIEVPNLRETIGACRKLLQTFMALEEGEYNFREFKYQLRDGVSWLQGFYDDPSLPSPISPVQIRATTSAKYTYRNKVKSSSDKLIKKDENTNQPEPNQDVADFFKTLDQYLQNVEFFCSCEQADERYKKQLQRVGDLANKIQTFLDCFFHADEQLLQQMYLPLVSVKLKADTSSDKLEAVQGSLFDALAFENALERSFEDIVLDSLSVNDASEYELKDKRSFDYGHSLFNGRLTVSQAQQSHPIEDTKSFNMVITPLLSSSRAAEFFKILRDMKFKTILTSATLRLLNNEGQQSFTRIKERLGLTQLPTECSIVPSPFDYQNNALVWMPGNFYSSQKQEANFEPDQQAILNNLRKVQPIINALHGGILVLTTKYSSIEVYAEQLQQICPERQIFTQQKGVNIEHTVQEFIRVQQEHQEAILVGTQSCWTGLNLQGRLLRLILIDKLPFEPPTLKQSMLKEMYYNGRQSPHSYFEGEILPNMLLKLKQGAGRLIRSEQDWGVVVLMYNLTKNYKNYVYQNFSPMRIVKTSNPSPIIDFILMKQAAEQMNRSFQ